MRLPIDSSSAAQLRELAQVKCGWITQVAWSPVTNTLAVACSNSVRLYVNTFGGAPTVTAEGHNGPIKGVAFSPDGTRIATVGADTILRVWDIAGAAPQVIYTLRGHQSSVEAVAFSPDGARIATASADMTVRLWDSLQGVELAVFKGHTSDVTTVDFLLQGNLIVSGGWDRTVRLWDVTSETGGTIQGQHEDWVRQVVANRAGTMFASASKDGTVRLWDTFEDRPYGRWPAHLHGVDTAHFQPDGRVLVTGGRDGLVRLWSLDPVLLEGTTSANEALVALRGHEKPVLSAAFNATGTLLATASGDNTVRLWSVEQA
jgi:WD40 repeat protein